MKGRNHTEESKRKMSEAKRGKPQSSSHKENRLKSLREHSRTKSHSENLSKSLIKPVSLISPEGLIVEIRGRKKFAKENGLSRNHFLDLCRGTISEHEGWRILS